MVPLDEGRKAVALEKTQDELRREMPQVMELLRTVVRVQVVAHREFGMAIRQMLPPYPPRIHTPDLFLAVAKKHPTTLRRRCSPS